MEVNKGKANANNLQVAGQPLTLRKEQNKFGRSPFSRHMQQNNLRNYVNRNNNHAQAKAALALLHKKKYL